VTEVHEVVAWGRKPAEVGHVSMAPSKFAPPMLPRHHVARAALADRLGTDAHALVLVLGSPGAGKTTLLAEWYRRQDPATATWMSADEGDADPARFWKGFISAVALVRDGFGEGSLDLLQLDPRVDHEVLESILIDDEHLTRPVSLVIDDFHHVGEEAQAQLRFLLNRGLKKLRVILGSRSEPDLGLERRRLDGSFVELRESDLRLAPDEGERMLAGLGVDLPAEASGEVIRRTEGWAAGLQLAALILVTGTDQQAVVERLSGTNVVIAQYLWAEVFARQQPDVQRLLVDTCVVDELTPSLAAALSPGNPISLLDIEAANLLLRRIESEAEVFRFHQLFAEMLRSRLRAEPRHEAVLHERAARWFEQRGELVAAFRHWWRADRRDEALRMMHGTILDVIYDPLPAMTEFERTLTDDDIRRQPAPSISFAVALLTNGFIADAERLASRIRATAHDLLRTDDERSQLLATRVIAALVQGDTRGAIERAERESVPSSDVDNEWHSLATLAAAKAHVWEGEHVAAEQALQRVAPFPSSLHRMEVANTRAHLHLARGELVASRAQLEAYLEQTGGDEPSELADGVLCRAVLGNVLLEQGEAERAEAELRAVADSVGSFRVPALLLARAGLCRLWAQRGRTDRARHLIVGAYRLIEARPYRSGMLDFVREHEVRLLLTVGALDDAAAVIDAIQPGVRRRLLTVRLDIARQRMGTALGGLGGCDDAALDSRGRLEVALLRLEATLATTPDASTECATVLDLAGAERVLFPVAEASPAALAGVQAAARRRPVTPFVTSVLRLQPRVPATHRSARPDQPLTDRELAVLRFMATSLSYREIAAELFVSLNTVKTHVKHINRKLDGTSRADSVRRARELDVL
jgi:LuxR family maltose regulon positive regulatory protein